LAYQPPASSTFLSEQTSHQQPASSTFLSEQTSTSHQPPAKRTGSLEEEEIRQEKEEGSVETTQLHLPVPLVSEGCAATGSCMGG
jgi:hypothetical protein